MNRKYEVPEINYLQFDDEEEILLASSRGRNAADFMNEHFLNGDGNTKTDLTTTVRIQDVNVTE